MVYPPGSIGTTCPTCKGSGEQGRGGPSISSFGGGGSSGGGGCLMVAVVLILAVFIVVMTGSWASAGESWDSRRPEAFPNYAASSAVVVDNVSAPARWQLRDVVEDYDARLGMINLWVGDCDAHPNLPCIRVRGVDRPHAYWGWFSTMINGWDADSYIVLNQAFGITRRVTCHEFGHALGLTHHQLRPGCLGVDGARRASSYELDALRDAYRG